MSDVLLPTLEGLTWDTTKSPEFNTITHRSANFKEYRASLSSTPLWHFKRTYELLRSAAAYAELQSLGGFFMARYGRWDNWLFADPGDSVAVLEPFGTGDGVTTEFQLKRAFGAFSEPCMNVAAGPSIYKAGALQGGGYSISSTGLVTFGSAPGSGQALTWSGTYYFRCRWDMDAQEYNEFMERLFELRTCEFVGSLGRKV
jgi:uncharacterized protein (TIGR02217 family)